MDLGYYARVLLRRLHYVLLLAVLGGAAGGALAVLLPPVYRAEARLVVESEQIPGDLAESTVRVEATEQLEIIRQRILARETLIEMANRLGVYAEAERARLAADDVVADLRERIGIVTTGGAPRTGPAQATIVTVSFEAPTAQLAAAVTNEVVTLILQENVEIRTRVAGQTLDFFEQEVERLDDELEAKGATIQAFQEANRDALPDSLEFRRGQLVSDQERLLQIDRDEALLGERRAALVAAFEATGGILPLSDAPQTAEQRQLEELRGQLASALAVLTPTNPRVRLLQGQITALEGVVAAQATGAPAAPGQVAGASAYDLQLADIDAQLAAIAAERERLAAAMDATQATIEATPGNAIALDTLQRDYAALRAQYDQAIQNRAAAATGEQIEALSRGQRIAIIEQAVAPGEPLSPNRPVVAAAGLGGGLALGLALVALLELLNRSVRRPVEVTRALGIATFAALPLVRSRHEVRRRRLILLAAFAATLVGLPAALWAVHTRVVPLDVALDRAVARLAELT